MQSRRPPGVCSGTSCRPEANPQPSGVRRLFRLSDPDGITSHRAHRRLTQAVASEPVAHIGPHIFEQTLDVVVHSEVENLPATFNEAAGSGD